MAVLRSRGVIADEGVTTKPLCLVYSIPSIPSAIMKRVILLSGRLGWDEVNSDTATASGFSVSGVVSNPLNSTRDGDGGATKSEDTASSRSSRTL